MSFLVLTHLSPVKHHSNQYEHKTASLSLFLPFLHQRVDPLSNFLSIVITDGTTQGRGLTLRVRSNRWFTCEQTSDYT